MSLTKSSIAGNTCGWASISGGAGLVVLDALNFLDTHATGIGVLCVIAGVFLQWYFKRREDKRATERHNKEMERRK